MLRGKLLKFTLLPRNPSVYRHTGECMKDEGKTSYRISKFRYPCFFRERNDLFSVVKLRVMILLAYGTFVPWLRAQMCHSKLKRYLSEFQHSISELYPLCLSLFL